MRAAAAILLIGALAAGRAEGPVSPAPAPSIEDPRLRLVQDFTCGTKRYCREMTSCEEAYYYLEVCGLRRLDGDSDGVPCETICPGG